MTSPYSYEGQAAVPAVEAAAEERARFLQRTYTTLFVAILALCGIIWATPYVPLLQNLGALIHANWLIFVIAFLAISWGVHALAEKYPINYLAFAGYILFFGVLIGPVVHYAQAQSAGLPAQAALLTAVIFTGLTAYVFISGKDFSFLGGLLTVMFFALLGLGLVSFLFGFHLGILFTGAVALFYALYILYDTSRILHHYPTHAHMTAAIVLFTDVVLLFYQLLLLLMQAQDD